MKVLLFSFLVRTLLPKTEKNHTNEWRFHMTRVLILTAILVMCLACSETETPIPREPEPVVKDKVPTEFPHALIESYAHIRADMTEPEYDAVLQYMYDFCHAQGDSNVPLGTQIAHNEVDLELKNTVSERVYNLAKGLPHPAATYDRKSRIKVRSWFIDPDVEVLFRYVPATGYTVIYNRAKFLRLLKLYERQHGQHGEVITRVTATEALSNSPAEPWIDAKRRSIADQIEKEFRDKGKVKIPNVLSELGAAYIWVDEVDGLPVESKYKDWIVHIDDAPRAIDVQIAEYNQIHSPDAYDCVEE